LTSALLETPVKRNDGSEDTLKSYAGKVLLVVNVASKCGLTPQYNGLEALYQAKKDQGLEVLGFPANDFNGQEPGSDEDIKTFCSTTFDVHFPLFAKISVLKDSKHPLYEQLKKAKPEAIGEGPMREKLKGFGIAPNEAPEILWNFEKFLIGRNGDVVARFAPDVAADDPRLVDAVEAELNKK
jgi:glutathione peroxidase